MLAPTPLATELSPFLRELRYVLLRQDARSQHWTGTVFTVNSTAATGQCYSVNGAHHFQWKAWRRCNGGCLWYMPDSHEHDHHFARRNPDITSEFLICFAINAPVQATCSKAFAVQCKDEGHSKETSVDPALVAFTVTQKAAPVRCDSNHNTSQMAKSGVTILQFKHTTPQWLIVNNVNTR